MAVATETNIGEVTQVIGPVIVVNFPSGQIPAIYNAIVIDSTTEAGVAIKLTAGVQQHLGDNRVKAVAMSSTDGVQRGMRVVDTGRAIAVPVGKATLGRIWNVLGEAIDQQPEPAIEERWPIHRPAPEL